MGKKTETKPTNMVQKQTLYIAILVAVTLGFMTGAAYTSFKLAKGQGGEAVGKMDRQMPPPQASGEQADAALGENILKLETYLKDHPDDVKAWVELGNTFYDSHRFKDAIEAYEKSLVLAPDDPNVLTDLGVMYRKNNNPEKAVACFDKAIKAHPEFETARFNKGIVLMHDLNDLPGAIKAWEELVEINPMAEAPNGQLVNTLIQGLKQQKN